MARAPMKPKDSDFRHTLAIPTAEGVFLARFSHRGLCELSFPGGRPPRGSVESTAAVPAQVRRWLAQTAAALSRALQGRAPRSLPPLDLTAGTDFQQEVWRVMSEIQPGQTRSYGELAQALRRPHAARAVGGACGANPIPVLVPCHRVLAGNRRLGGFSGGLDWKRRLLEREGVRWSE